MVDGRPCWGRTTRRSGRRGRAAAAQSGARIAYWYTLHIQTVLVHCNSALPIFMCLFHFVLRPIQRPFLWEIIKSQFYNNTAWERRSQAVPTYVGPKIRTANHSETQKVLSGNWIKTQISHFGRIANQIKPDWTKLNQTILNKLNQNKMTKSKLINNNQTKPHSNKPNATKLYSTQT